MKLKIGHQRRIAFIIFLIILLIGAILRVYNLEGKGYWVDEEFSIKYASLTLQELMKNAENESNPPLYYIILHFLINFFGDSEISTRLLSALFGVMAIFIMYSLGKLLFDKETGIIASLILTISAFHIAHSQETRMYSLMAMLTLISMYFFVKIMKEKNTKFVICYIISSVLLIYSHIYGLFIIIVQNLYIIILLISSKEKFNINFKKWITIQLLLLAAFTPWILVLIKQIIKIKSGAFGNISWLTTPTLQDLFNTFLLYVYYNPITLTLFLLLSLSVIITWKKFGRNTNMKSILKSIITKRWSIKISKSGIHFLLILWLLIPILIPYVISKLILPIYSLKYTISASLAFYILVARGIRQIKNKYLKGILLLAVILLSSTSILYYYYFEKSHEPWREVASYVDKNANKNDLVIVKPYYAKSNFERYSKRDNIRVIDEKSNIPTDTTRIWFVLRYEEINESLKKYTPIVKEKFGNITIYLINKSD